MHQTKHRAGEINIQVSTIVSGEGVMRLRNLRGKEKIITTLMLILLLFTLITQQSNSKSTNVERFIISDDSGPIFDLTRLPDFVDLIPGSEPVIFSLDLRVGVSDPDHVDTVIGSYNNNSDDWVNISLNYDESTSDPDDYAAHALNYTIPGGTSHTIWNIRFFANDSLGNWNVSRLKTMSVSRQSFGNGITPPVENLVAGLLIGATIIITFVIVITWYTKSKKSTF